MTKNNQGRIPEKVERILLRKNAIERISDLKEHVVN
jgi:hypothetical protein